MASGRWVKAKRSEEITRFLRCRSLRGARWKKRGFVWDNSGMMRFNRRIVRVTQYSIQPDVVSGEISLNGLQTLLGEIRDAPNGDYIP